MLGVPSLDIAEEPNEGRNAEKPKTESLESLFELADQVRSHLGGEVDFCEIDGKLTAVRRPSGESRQSSKSRPNRRNFDFVMPILGTLVIGVSGYLVYKSDMFVPNRGHAILYRPASLAEAHRFLAKNSVDPLLSVANRPLPKISPPEPLEDPILRDLESNPKLKLPENTASSPPFRASRSDRFDPAPVPMQGQIADTLPDPSNLRIEPQTPASKRGSEDTHLLEAQVRTMVNESGARVIRVSESDSGKSLYISVASTRAPVLMSKIASQMGSSVVVSAPRPDDSDNGEVDEVKEAEIKQAEGAVASLKKQIDQAEISFLPNAPALKGLHAEYSNALIALSEIKRRTHPNSVLKVKIPG